MNTHQRLCLFMLSMLIGLDTAIASESMNEASSQGGAGLSGTYTVGDVLADFEDLNTAFDVISTDGISGPVILNIVPGVHQVHATLGEFNHLDQPDDPLIIQSEDAMNPAKFQHDAISANDNWILKLDGVSYVEVKNLIFEATGTADFASLLALENGSQHITISENQFFSYDINPQSDEQDGSSLLAISPSELSDITITNNAFEGGNMAIFLYGLPAIQMQNINISENRFIDQDAIGSFNVVLLNYVNDVIFNQNIINNVTNNGKGLRVNQVDGASINANQISMLGAGNGGIGMRLSSLNVDGISQTQITNNFILASHKGLVLDNLSQQVDVHHNSIVAHGAMASFLSFGLQVTTTAGAQIDIQNNLILSTMTHPQAAIISYSGGNALQLAEHNIYHGLSIDPYVYDGIAYATLGDYQLASGLDVDSLDMVVNFVDMINGDLHLAPGQYNDTDLLVVAASGVVYDVDGQTRLPFATHKGADDLDAEIIFKNGFNLIN